MRRFPAVLAALLAAVPRAASATEVGAVPASVRQYHGSEPHWDEFERFVRNFRKAYALDEWELRFRAFQASADFVEKENAKSGAFTLGINEYADLSAEEFSQARIGLNSTLRSPAGDSPLLESFAGAGAMVPGAVDWAKQGVLPPVSDQGSCGSCWAYAATAALSASWRIATGSLQVLSEQQLMDCSIPYGNLGCAGGNMDNAFVYARSAALCTLASYPDSGTLGMCRSGCAVAIPRGGVLGFRTVMANNEPALLEAVMQQPVAAGIAAERSAMFQLYSSGVMSGNCGFKPNHAVVLVGFGTDQGTPYWSIRNSWGSRWGEAGYFRLARGPGPQGSGECGVLTMPSYPLVNAKAPKGGGASPAPSSPQATSGAAYGRPPCPDGAAAASVATAAGVPGEVCAPECTPSLDCPPPGQCVLREGGLGGRQFCAVVCMDSSVCLSGARCSQVGGGAGVCLFERGFLAAGSAGALLLQVADDAASEAAAGGPGRRLSDEAARDIFA